MAHFREWQATMIPQQMRGAAIGCNALRPDAVKGLDGAARRILVAEDAPFPDRDGS